MQTSCCRLPETAGRGRRQVKIQRGDAIERRAQACRLILADHVLETLLVNNAGLGGQQMVATADADAAERMIKVNVIALTRLTRAVLPGLLARNRGAIVNIASVLAFDTSFGGIYSGGTKAYVVNFTEALLREVADTKVTAQVVLPGATRTEFWEVAGSDIANIPQEIVMTADDLVDAALVGLAKGETVTAPGLADAAGLETYLGARQGFFGSLLAGKPAARYAA